MRTNAVSHVTSPRTGQYAPAGLTSAAWLGVAGAESDRISVEYPRSASGAHLRISLQHELVFAGLNARQVLIFAARFERGGELR
eukprot:2428788-Prymnesium_polylepis.2